MSCLFEGNNEYIGKLVQSSNAIDSILNIFQKNPDNDTLQNLFALIGDMFKDNSYLFEGKVEILLASYSPHMNLFGNVPILNNLVWSLHYIALYYPNNLGDIFEQIMQRLNITRHYSTMMLSLKNNLSLFFAAYAIHFPHKVASSDILKTNIHLMDAIDFQKLPQVEKEVIFKGFTNVFATVNVPG